MAEPIHFEICFPSHISKVPVCRPGSSIAGTVVIKVGSPLAATYLSLTFIGLERVRCTPFSNSNASFDIPEHHQTTIVGSSGFMTKEFFRKELILWGDHKKQETCILGCEDSHRFHFTITMPMVNFPTPRETPDAEITYTLVAKLYSQVAGERGKEKVVKAIHSTPVRHFFFEPVVNYDADEEFTITRPYERSLVLMEPGAQNAKNALNMHVMHCHGAFVPGDKVEMLLLVPGSRAIRNASYQLCEKIRCRKSSAPVIDEVEIPVLWKTHREFKMDASISFERLDKSNITQDLGFLGRFMFTSLTALPACLGLASVQKQGALPSPIDAAISPIHTQSINRTSDSFVQSSPTTPVFGVSLHKHESRTSLASFRARYEQLPLIPVPLGNVLKRDSFRFARIRFIMPSIEHLAPVSSVFLDFSYTIQVKLTVSTNFGGSRNLVGYIPIKVVTSRTYTRDEASGSGPPPHNGRSCYRDSYSSFNARFNTTNMSDAASRLSLTPTLSSDSNTTNIPTSRTVSMPSSPLATEDPNKNKVLAAEEGCGYPTVQTFLQQGLRIPTPKFEVVDIAASSPLCW